MAEQGRQRPVRAGQCVQAHHLRGGAGCRGHHKAFQLLLRGIHLSGRHPLPLCQPQAPRSPERDPGAGKFLQPELHPDRARLGREAFCDYFAAFGLREPTGIDLPAEPKKSLYYTADRMGPVELASCAFGQSSKISYLEMAAAVCAVVNGGKLMQLTSSRRSWPRTAVPLSSSPLSANGRCSRQRPARPCGDDGSVVLHGGGRNAQIPGYR